MSFDFSVPPAVEQQRMRIAGFIRDQVIPLEQQAFRDGVDDPLRLRLQTAARQAGLWAPQLPAAYGGGGFYVGPPYHYYGGGLSLILVVVLLVILLRR